MDEPKLSLHGRGWGALALPCVPGIVLLASSGLLDWGAKPHTPLAQTVSFDGHAEAAMRITALSTFVALTALGLASILYFAWHLRLFRTSAAAFIAAAALAAATAGTYCVAHDVPAQAQLFMGNGAVRTALRRFDEHCAPSPAPKSPLARFVKGRPKDCGDGDYPMLERLNAAQRYFLAFVSAALVLGAVACLGAPAVPTAAQDRAQARRLQIYLYLSAAVLVSGLAYLSAMLRWPGWGLADKDVATAYRAHADAIVLYWGVTYSAFIATYYLPVATALSHRLARQGVGLEEVEKSVLGGVGLVKAAAAIAAPTIAALIGGLAF